MKYPKHFQKWPHEDKSKWIADELAKVRAHETELLKISRELSSIKGFVSKVKDDDRPDLIAMK